MMENNILYNDIGKGYNSTRKADPYITEKIYHLLSVNKGTCLDVGCGTGNYTIALAAKGICFYGLDPSNEMLTFARLRGNDIIWLQGSAENIPVKDILFDGAVATLTIHHWNNLSKAFSELYRLLKPGARLVIFTAAPDQMNGYWLNHYFPEMMQRSIKKMPSAETIIQTLISTGFMIYGEDRYLITPDLQDNFLYSGKHDPERYFNIEIRKGISSFAALANRKEINNGLSNLRKHINNGDFEKIKSGYENNKGDYLFITAIKPG